MTEPSCRPLRMSDAMILIAATAVGFAEARSLFEDISESGRGLWIMSGIILTITLLPALSVAFLVIRLRRPRPSWDRLWKQPGAMACLAGGIPSALLGLLSAAMQAAPEVHRNPIGLFVGADILGGLGISYFWVIMKLTRGWRPEAGWIDRGGIVLGVLWISTITVPPCVICIISVIF